MIVDANLNVITFPTTIGGIQYPPNYPQCASPADLAAIGLQTVIDNGPPANTVVVSATPTLQSNGTVLMVYVTTPEPAPVIPPPGPALSAAASAACSFISRQIVPDTVHQNAYQLAAGMVGPSATVPAAAPVSTDFAAMAASFGYQPQAFATLVVAITASAFQLSAILAACQSVAANPASTQAQLETALSTFETSIAAFVTSINSAGLAITVVAPPAIVIPGINA